tara:strand:+ start:1333 stop:1815 length:483 start_codon:yes stop_codon:yes gene_type:complete
MKIMPVLSGKAHWASIANPNTTFEPVYSIDLAIEGDELNKARQLGLTIKNKGDDRGNFVTIKRKQYRKDGSENKRPDLVDSNKNNMGNTLVGNGSDVNVLFKTFEWEYAGKTGMGTELQKVQVTNLIEYSDGSDDFDVVPDGYSAVDTLNDDIPFGNTGS